MIEVFALCVNCGAYVKVDFRVVRLSQIDERIRCCDDPHWMWGIGSTEEDRLSSYSGRSVVKGRKFLAEEVFPELFKK